MTTDASSGVETDPLLVFGYGCQIFRDDVRALAMERGDHLIPWMGHAELPIDRYDGRGALSDLKIHEARSGREGFDPWTGLSPDQVQEERQAESQRYLALFEDELAVNGDKASEAGGGAAVPFDYDQAVPAQPAVQSRVQPTLRQLANCIEKTSEFIVKQGAQMEILMRAKEANNPLFQFLNPENPYHAIYKEVFTKKKNRPKNYVANQVLMEQSSLEVEESLKILFSRLNSAPGLNPTPTSSSSSTNAYSQLVDRIRVNQAPPSQPVPPQAQPPPAQPVPKVAVPPPVSSEHIVEVVPPPISLQPLIDRTAYYVTKNGSEALNVVKKREPGKFSFLNPSDKYHLFFQYKVALYKEMVAAGYSGPTQRGSALLKNNGSTSSGAGSDQSFEQVTSKFPSLKGFFR
ncbi:hypothetical protein TCAL_08112 [Tigriopus californicus]|uniref:SURP motif domain-containing protein n=1 Tax=Tigriopus californicus TaxID=6832 RepID=A0A553PJN5_TIGCA|nr:splicing factor, suppressor of white-apricot homolog [Tigriopus californicus]TRY77897.1 hypothetical protein TCAL_08112 [Tigriopus californicus]|eukprot:TCALIF_08112-PA protein Name:"Similar to Sfswap Splicing factor, suppressor of white-apricot homolog (Mus musculus)" AED:0.03 eAED:0.03 QI:432/1/1/1/1/1/3/57/403